MTNNYSEEATTFNRNDAPDGMREDGIESFNSFYNRIYLTNSLRWNGGWRDEKVATDSDNHAICDVVASQLELTPYQKSEAHDRFGELPRQLLQAYQSSLLALCVCGLVGQEDGRNYHPNNVHPESDTETDFTQLFDDINVSYTELYSCWNRVKGEMQ